MGLPSDIGRLFGSMDIQQSLIASFGQWLLLGGLSRDTSTSYMSTITTFAKLKTIAEVNDKLFFIKLKEKLQGKNSSLSTIARHTFAFKKFLVFLNEEHGIPIINILSIRCKKAKRPHPTYLERDEIELMRQSPIGGLNELRNRTLLEFLIFTGCRISECITSNWNDIDFEKGELLVRGKGDKSRIVFMGNAVPWVQRYLRERGDRNEALFLSQYHQRLNRQSACVIIREMAKRVGITKRVYPHMLRTTFATHMIRQGVDARVLQEMLGHEDIETTLKHYVGVSHNHMKVAHENLVKLFKD